MSGAVYVFAPDKVTYLNVPVLPFLVADLLEQLVRLLEPAGGFGSNAQRPVRASFVVASRRTLGHGLHSTAGSQAGQGQQSSGQAHLPRSHESDPFLASRPARCQRESDSSVLTAGGGEPSQPATIRCSCRFWRRWRSYPLTRSAVKTWLPRPRSGPVFRAEALGGMVSDMALADGEAIRRGLDPAVYWGTRCAPAS